MEEEPTETHTQESHFQSSTASKCNDNRVMCSGEMLEGGLANLQSCLDTIYKDLPMVTENAKSLQHVYRSETEKLQNKIQNLKPELIDICERIKRLTSLLGDANTWQEDLGIESEGMMPAEMILPVEVWEYILKKVTDGKDLLTCRNVCQLWMEEIHRQKPLLLFSQAFPSIAKYLPYKDRRNARFICKVLKNSMDCLVDFHPYRYYTYDPIRTFLATVGRIDRFLKEMAKFPSANPFISGLNVCDMSVQDEQRNEYWQRVIQVLQMFGHHVRHLKVEYHNNSEVTLRELLEVGLTRLPNITTLKLLILNWEVTDPEINLCDLHHLECLELSSEMNNALSNVILAKYGHRLKKVHLGEELLSDDWNWSREIPSLEHLKIHVGRINSIQLSKIRFGNWNLRRITAYVNSKDARIVQRLVTMSRDTLTELKINYDGYPLDMAHMPFKCCLPKLQKLTMYNYSGSYDFLEGTKALTHLSIVDVAGGLDPDPREVFMELETFHVIGNLSHMYESNVWILMPYLRSVYIECVRVEATFYYYYFRETYEKLMKEKVEGD